MIASDVDRHGPSLVVRNGEFSLTYREIIQHCTTARTHKRHDISSRTVKWSLDYLFMMRARDRLRRSDNQPRRQVRCHNVAAVSQAVPSRPQLSLRVRRSQRRTNTTFVQRLSTSVRPRRPTRTARV